VQPAWLRMSPLDLVLREIKALPLSSDKSCSSPWMESAARRVFIGWARSASTAIPAT